METAQLVLSQFKKLSNVINWELNKVYFYQEQLVGLHVVIGEVMSY